MTDAEDSLKTVLEQEYEKIHQSIIGNLRGSNPNIYHYTDYEGLKKILSSRILRLTDYRYMNDPTELQYGQETIKNIILKSDIPHKLIMWNILDGYVKHTNQTWKIYIVCFSFSKDKLSLWRNYAKNGTGFAIGFKDYFKL